jgi:hypothetical protein
VAVSFAKEILGKQAIETNSKRNATLRAKTKALVYLLMKGDYLDSLSVKKCFFFLIFF